MKLTNATFLGPAVPYVKYDEAGRILQRGRTHLTTLEHLIARGDRVIQADVDPNAFKVVDGKLKKLTKVELAERDRTETQEAEARIVALPVNERRAAEYPPLNEFAEAVAERELGDDTKWKIYLKRVAAVRAKHPRE